MQRATSLLVHIDPGGPEGLQRQIYRSIRGAILEGRLRPGARVPSSRALARDLGVSRTTTVLALEQLAAEGYLHARPASGLFVADLALEGPARPVDVAGPAAARHPPLSRRGLELAAITAPGGRIPGAPRPFRIGVPALDLFPARPWSQLLTRRVRALARQQLDYGDARGLPALRRAIADHVSTTRGTRCTADQVLVVAGAQQGIDLACHLLLDPGDPAWLEEPGYPGALSALRRASARAVPVPVDAEGLDVEAGRRLAPAARLAYVTPSHQFPLGLTMTLPRRLALLRWAQGAGAWVVEDDYDSEFRHGVHPVPCLHGLDTDGRVVYVGSFSKSLAPALRLGFLVLAADLVDQARAVRKAADLHPPLLEQAVLADFIAQGHFERHLRRMRCAYHERLEGLKGAAHALGAGALSLRPIQAGLHCVADLVEADAVRVAREAAVRGVEVMPLAAYCADPGAAPQALVMGFAAVRPEDLWDGMRRLMSAIEAARRT